MRAPCRRCQMWLEACEGEFSKLDSWLESVGFHPLQVAGLPRSLKAESSVEAIFKSQKSWQLLMLVKMTTCF